MPEVFHLVVRVLSVVTGIMLLAFGVESIGGQRESSDVLKAVLFALSAVSFGLNLVRLPRSVAFIIAAFHAVGLFYVMKQTYDMARYAFGESGGKQGAWAIFLPIVFLVVALLASVIFNLVRPDDALRQN